MGSGCWGADLLPYHPPPRTQHPGGDMGTLVLRRLAAMIPVLVLVTFAVFALIHLTPGDPIDAMMGESFDAGAKDRLRLDLGLDQPIHVQYVTWVRGVLVGDFGRSIRDRQPVIENV